MDSLEFAIPGHIANVTSAKEKSPNLDGSKCLKLLGTNLVCSKLKYVGISEMEN